MAVKRKRLGVGMVGSGFMTQFHINVNNLLSINFKLEKNGFLESRMNRTNRNLI